jgi:hypothetical protein
MKHNTVILNRQKYISTTQEKSDSGIKTNTSKANTTLNKTYSIQSSTSTTFKNQYLNSKGYCVWSSYANSVYIASLKKQGFNDIYFN